MNLDNVSRNAGNLYRALLVGNPEGIQGHETRVRAECVATAVALETEVERQVDIHNRTVKGLPQKDRIRGALIAYKQEGV